MADKEKDSGKADKAERAAKVDKSPEAQARAEKAAAAKAKAAAKKAAESGEKKPREPEEKVTPRLRTQFDEVIRKALTEQFGYKNPMQVPRVDKIVLNMGIGEGVADRKKVEQAAEAMAAIAGQKAGHHQVAQVDRDLQAARRPGDRLQGHAAQGAHVRIPRPPGEHRAAARARLPRAQSEELRRPRQLLARHQGAHRFSRRSTTTRRQDVWGMDITVCTTARNDDEARALLTAFNFPFRQ